MLLDKYVKTIKKFFLNVINQQCRVLTLVKSEEKWKAICEVIVDPEYTTRKGLGDIVEIYEVYLTDDFQVIGYELKSTKPRASIDE